jgi:hypothetical protein
MNNNEASLGANLFLEFRTQFPLIVDDLQGERLRGTVEKEQEGRKASGWADQIFKHLEAIEGVTMGKENPRNINLSSTSLSQMASYFALEAKTDDQSHVRPSQFCGSSRGHGLESISQ